VLVHLSRVGFVHVRRALLLFAIVLGFAALAAAISQAPRRTGANRAPIAAPLPEAEVRPPVRLELSARGRPRSLRLAAGNAATLTVSVPEPGQVELQDPALTSPAEPSTPASFPLLIDRPARYPVLFTAVDSDEPRRIGTVIVRR